jgi:hypothetical protein
VNIEEAPKYKDQIEILSRYTTVRSSRRRNNAIRAQTLEKLQPDTHNPKSRANGLLAIVNYNICHDNYDFFLLQMDVWIPKVLEEWPPF